MGDIESHLEELKISLDDTIDNRVLPEIIDTDKTMFGIGCGSAAGYAWP